MLISGKYTLILYAFEKSEWRDTDDQSYCTILPAQSGLCKLQCAKSETHDILHNLH